jgi:hypothetical protein
MQNEWQRIIGLTSFHIQLQIDLLFGDTSSCNAYQKPKSPIFSGEEKSETSFDVWKLEVKCVLATMLISPFSTAD